MGDAAHATTPFMGSGAAMAFEDAAMLSALLGATKSKNGVSRAFQVFDETRRPRCQRIIDASKESGLMMSGESEAGLDPKRLAEALGPRWGFIVAYSIKESMDEAVKMLDVKRAAVAQQD